MRRWFRIALFNLLLAAIIGALLRALYIWEIPFVRFRPFLHAHSHVALLGWLFIGVVLCLLHDGGNGTLTKRTRWLLLALQGTVMAMLLSFPVQGYGAASIAASSAHLLLAYPLLAMVWRASRSWPAQGSGRLTRWAIAFFAVSTVGTWALPVIIATGNQGKEVYYWAVQFFLHFQFNGWFWFAAMAIGARWAERNAFDLRIDRLTTALWVVSAILTYSLAIAWSEPHPAVFATVSTAVALQAWAAVRMLRLLLRLRTQAYTRFTPWARVLIGMALVSMALKVLVQAAVAVPSVAMMSLTVRHLVMGFIHMNTLGTMSALLLAYAITHDWFSSRFIIARAGLLLLALGIIASELLLFAQGTFFWLGWGMMPGHYATLFGASALMPGGILLVLLSFRDRLRAPKAADH
ncbi:MAG: hypothetical protein IPM46_06750 [Flavobacteriales bacterium]|nr:hypothetical protein [Flavobacteriales bacterium]